MFRQIDLQDFTIPAGHSNYRVDSTYEFDVPVQLYSLYPHMHVRGKSFSFEAEWPDGRREMLLDVPEYDFNWQTIYALEDPIRLPAGSQIHCVAHFDNSAGNPANPNPNIDVPWGPNTEDEMMIGVFMTIELSDPEGQHKQTSTDQDPLERNIGGLIVLSVAACIAFLIPILRK